MNIAVGLYLSLFLLFFPILQNTSLCANNVVSIALGELYIDGLREDGMLFKRHLTKGFGMRMLCERADIASHFKTRRLLVTLRKDDQACLPLLQGFLYWISLCVWTF